MWVPPGGDTVSVVHLAVTGCGCFAVLGRLARLSNSAQMRLTTRWVGWLGWIGHWGPFHLVHFFGVLLFRFNLRFDLV